MMRLNVNLTGEFEEFVKKESKALGIPMSTVLQIALAKEIRRQKESELLYEEMMEMENKKEVLA